MRFGELGVFPEDVDIPVGVVSRLWAATGELDEFETEDLLSRFYDLSLLLNFDLGRCIFRLHDTVRHFLQDQAGAEGLAAQHKRVVAALDERRRTPPRDVTTISICRITWLRRRNAGIVRLWDVSAGAESARLEGHLNWVTALCLLPDGRLASGSWNGKIRLWDVSAGAETASLDGHSNWVVALCLLPDGRLASGSWDNTAMGRERRR